ncbi:MAG TPA: hypothetical protein DEA08_22535 [Planctomycetes bacterium]|nr:hypothetical protein [Planctomycetota bacterium]
MKVVTFRRWLLPASGLSLALAGVVYLCALEVSEWPAADPGAAQGSPTLACLDAGAGPGGPQGPAAARARGARIRVAAPGSGAGRAAGAHTDPAQGDLLTQLRHGADLADRLVILDDHLRSVSFDQALDDLERLVEAGLPGGFSEAEQLRLAVISRLGRLDDPRVERALVDRIQPRIPRPQRLLALELLAPRYAARGAIHAVAEHDADPVVREKARWALRKTR